MQKFLKKLAKLVLFLLVAALLDMRLKNSVPCIFLGVCIAATIMTLITFGVISVI